MGKATRDIAAIGTALAGIIGAGYLIAKHVPPAKPCLASIKLESQPVKIEVLIDDKIPAVTPATVELSVPAKHKFSAPLRCSDLLRIYEFYQWTLDGKPVSYDLTAEIPIQKASTVKAEFILAEVHPYPLTITM
jgi:hypothetical protein